MNELNASIDIGSNSILLSICKVENRKIKEEIISKCEVTSLGKGIDQSGYLNSDSMKLSLEVLESYGLEMKKHNIKELIITATEACRVALNTDSFFYRIESLLKQKVSLLTGEGEAYYTALGVASALKESGQNIVIMDLGGASTELILLGVDPFSLKQSISIPCGSVRATQYREQGIFENKLDLFSREYDFSSFRASKIICVAGSMTALATMFMRLPNFNGEKLNGLTIPAQKFAQFVESIQNNKVESVLRMFPFLGKRSESIVSGAVFANWLVQSLEVKDIVISTYGLRHGVLIEGRIDERFIFRR